MRKLWSFLASKQFAWCIIGLFVLEAVWIAASARYPMASDEDFHFGIIQIYSHQLSPFFAAQPNGADVFGAVVRDPSYLQHYLMSFPLRILRAVGLTETGQVIGLRLISVAFAAASLVLLRRLLQHTSLAPRAINFVLLLFVLVPIFPFVAAQINYDNMFFFGTAGALLLTVRLVAAIRDSKRLPLNLLVGVIVVCLLNSLVKFAFLPIFFVIAGAIILALISRRRDLRSLWHDLWRQCQALSRPLRVVVIGLLLLSTGLFLERYGYNAVKYHSLTPECDTVLSIKECQAYGPWVRNYKFKTIYYENRQRWNIAEFSQQWFGNYIDGLQFALNGPFSNYTLGAGLPVMGRTIQVLLVSSLVPLAWCSRRLWRRDPALRFLLVVGLTYVGVLYLQNYFDFKTTGQAVAQQGRYLLPVLVLLLAWLARCWSLLLADLPKPVRKWRGAIALLIILGFAQGGGATTFIVRSDNDWYWQNNAVRVVNQAARQALRPLFIGA